METVAISFCRNRSFHWVRTVWGDTVCNTGQDSFRLVASEVWDLLLVASAWLMSNRSLSATPSVLFVLNFSVVSFRTRFNIRLWIFGFLSGDVGLLSVKLSVLSEVLHVSIVSACFRSCCMVLFVAGRNSAVIFAWTRVWGVDISGTVFGSSVGTSTLVDGGICLERRERFPKFTNILPFVWLAVFWLTTTGCCLGDSPGFFPYNRPVFRGAPSLGVWNVLRSLSVRAVSACAWCRLTGTGLGVAWVYFWVSLGGLPCGALGVWFCCRLASPGGGGWGTRGDEGTDCDTWNPLGTEAE